MDELMWIVVSMCVCGGLGSLLWKERGRGFVWHGGVALAELEYLVVQFLHLQVMLGTAVEVKGGSDVISHFLPTLASFPPHQTFLPMCPLVSSPLK